MKTDNKVLLELIERCFQYSEDARLSLSRRNELLALGKRLRGTLTNLLTAEFASDLEKVKNANASLSKVNETLKNVNNAVTNIADTIKEINQLAKALDGLLKLAVSFK